MSLSYRRLAASVLFPAHEALKGHRTVAVLRRLERTQWWDPAEIEKDRMRRLRRFLVDVDETVPYFRRLFAERGFRPRSVASVEDLARLPLLDKSAIRANVEALRTTARRRLRPFQTGGSTGSPLRFYLGKERIAHDVAAKWRATRWWGCEIGDPEIVVWGSPLELGAQDRLRHWRDRILRTRLLPAFEMSPARLDEFLEAIRRDRPRMLFGYPSALAHLARHALDRGADFSRAGIAVAFVTGEQLLPHHGEQIALAFGCPVANGYGARDAGFVAHACPDGGMHLSAEDIVAEVVDEAGEPLPPGRVGELVVTHLATRDFPFLRYRTGDLAALDDRRCTCGRGLPLLKEIHGRTTDLLVAADGAAVHALALIYVIRETEGIRDFRIVQEDRLRVRIEIVADESFGEEGAERLARGVRRRLGETVRVDVERVRAIPPAAGGKHRHVVSRVAPRGETR